MAIGSIDETRQNLVTIKTMQEEEKQPHGAEITDECKDKEVHDLTTSSIDDINQTISSKSNRNEDPCPLFCIWYIIIALIVAFIFFEFATGAFDDICKYELCADGEPQSSKSYCRNFYEMPRCQFEFRKEKGCYCSDSKPAVCYYRCDPRQTHFEIDSNCIKTVQTFVTFFTFWLFLIPGFCFLLPST